MSASIAFALIIATFFPGMFCFLYASKMANDIADETVTGVVRGVPVPRKYRGIKFFQMFLGYVLIAVVCALFVALVTAGIGQHAVDANVRGLAYATAFIGAAGALGWLFNAASALLYFRFIWRETAKN